jgi:hypothetical protein
MRKIKTLVMVATVAILTMTLTSADPVCPPQTGFYTLIANPDNCCEYFECDNGLPRPMACPDDLFFCSELGACAYSWDMNCSFNCTVVSDWCGGNDWTGGGGSGVDITCKCSKIQDQNCATNNWGSICAGGDNAKCWEYNLNCN